ncbi:MAG: hypothetical protein JW720_01565 [Sedimentisphaerales bacterium]|nr:hypothetical protein [Sedimentisphaerales bacterium]
MNPKHIEKYSSAITLSDMEIFVFPELMYSLVLANIMSPVIWGWRDLDCFKKLSGKSSYRKLMRLKQFIIDEFDFNLDLETWGLTSRPRELARFKDFISPDDIVRSNALFGYEGDKYYFDVDIRRHFGLDKYDSEIIPYWKTETVEAMDAFRLKDGYERAAGECVSLAALYAAAAFVVCGIPLEDIYMILTPLHSQNFIDLQDGILTNNRRLVTKTMWFNGTPISNKAQRALRNENVTIVSHSSGYVHCLYEDATIDKESYRRFSGRLSSYLQAEVEMSVFANFLRSNQEYQKYFQVCRDCHGRPQFMKAEVLFHYEHGSNYRIGETTFEKLLGEVSDEDFSGYELPGRIRCDRLDKFMEAHRPDLSTAEGKSLFRSFVEPAIPDAAVFVESLSEFLHTRPKLPSFEKNYVAGNSIEFPVDCTREEVIEYLQSIREKNITADLAFYSYRDMRTCDWSPFVAAAVERNPVCIEKTRDMSIEDVCEWLSGLGDGSIYDTSRAAQPDEVANYGSGDGFEKAFLLAAVIRRGQPDMDIEIVAEGSKVTVGAGREYHFDSGKNLKGKVNIPGGKDI